MLIGFGRRLRAAPRGEIEAVPAVIAPNYSQHERSKATRPRCVDVAAAVSVLLPIVIHEELDVLLVFQCLIVEGVPAAVVLATLPKDGFLRGCG